MESAIKRRENGYNRLTDARIFLPILLAKWPWPRQINPEYAMLKKEADAWMNSFKVFSPKPQDAFNRCNLCLLACLTYPIASKEHARAGCDLMLVFFAFDEHSDKATPEGVRKQKDMILDALQNPHIPRPKGEWVIAEMTRQFWERTIQNATMVSQKRFIQSMTEYLEGVVQESIDKEDGRILDVEGYINARRRSSGVKPSFIMNELGFDIPDEVMSHPAMQEMISAGIDLVGLTNDLCSYNMEQHRGIDVHNIVTCAMNEYKTDVNGAMMWVQAYLLGAEERFHAALAALPQWEEPLNSQVKQYCEGIGHWVRGNYDWCFEGERYFGNKGPMIKEKRWLSLLPKEHGSEVGPVHIDSSLL